MTLASQMVSDVADVFLNTDEHAINITYHSVVSGVRSITAVMTEQAGGPQDQRHVRTLSRRAVFCFADNVTTGIPTLNEQDWIEVSADTETENWVFAKILEHNNGMWTIEALNTAVSEQGMSKGNGY